MNEERRKDLITAARRSGLTPAAERHANTLCTLEALADVRAERQGQDAKWGGTAHDDTHTNFDWIAYITKHTGRAVFRRQMVRVAALAVAAIEWCDRQEPTQWK